MGRVPPSGARSGTEGDTMRRAWTGSVGVVLTLLAATGRADEEVVWRAVSGAKPVVGESPQPASPT